jgi:CHASE3 domain sensor protein
VGRNRTIHGQIFALKLMPVILLVIGFASALQLWFHTVDATSKSEHQNAVFTAAQALLDNTLDAQTSARAYVATAQPAYLVPYRGALPLIPARAQQLSTLVAGDDAQARRARSLEDLSARGIATLSRCVALMDAGQRRAARARIACTGGQSTLELLQREVGSLESAVERDASTTLDTMKLAGLQTLWTLVCCISLGAVFAAAAAWRIRAAIRARVNLLVRKAQRLATGEDIGPRLVGHDEISDLDRAFHDMAELLAERTADLERYRLLAERTACLMLFSRQSDGRILHANAAALAQYGY